MASFRIPCHIDQPLDIFILHPSASHCRSQLRLPHLEGNLLLDETQPVSLSRSWSVPQVFRLRYSQYPSKLPHQFLGEDVWKLILH